ncbi:M20 metallopeptidase family protein [Breznakia pachnodae]|uniref:Hippurate hydrolase n=1 Tax=Breznakia pachnodae TaxID=265178 RepID=A0ABU0DXE3_9FIRM|nr:amidohydrolase [Breznakia pachnodae]MDQ0359297.1 hippurate hydrolase [Breznakia pachnodae]
MDIREEVKALEEDVKGYRRHLHQYPEIRLEVPMTRDYIVEQLTSFGFEDLDVELMENAIIAQLRVENSASSVGFRADMDALSVIELNDIDFKSKNEYMHACGHDGHMAALLGLAKVLAKNKEKLSETVTFVFQPAEEGPGGAEILIKNGLFKKYPMRAIFGTHVMGEVDEGVIATRPGPLMARNGEIRVHITGKGTHGATPQLGNDAIVAGSWFVTQLQSIVARNVSPLKSGVVTIGSFNGGTAENIIAEEVVMEGTMRSFDDETYELIKQRIYEIGKGMEVSFGVKADIEVIDYYLVVENDNDLFDVMEKAVGEELYVVDPKMAAEDFSFYQKEVPGLFYFIGTRSKKFDQHLHNATYNFDEKVLLNVIETNLRILETMGTYHD